MGKPASIPALPPLWVLLFVASAVLFLGGAAIFWGAGASSKALAGLAGALASVVMIVAFHGKDHPPRR